VRVLPHSRTSIPAWQSSGGFLKNPAQNFFKYGDENAHRVVAQHGAFARCE